MEAGTASGNMAAGVPDITGNAGVTGVGYANKGCMIFTVQSSGYVGGGNSSAGLLSISASLSDATYGNSRTVQPAVITLVPQLRY